MQRRMIRQVLHDRQIEIERPRLEHDAKPAQCLGGRAVYVESENTDRALLRREEAGDQGKQRTFAGAVEAEKDAETALGDT